MGFEPSRDAPLASKVTMRVIPALTCLLCLQFGAGCARISTSRARGSAATSSSAAARSSSAADPTTVAAVSSGAPALRGGVACGQLGCSLFDSPAAAFAAVLSTGPRVLGIGEAHAQKGTEGVESATRRFAALLPDLGGHATDLVLELWVGRSDCVETERRVREKQKPVTEPQAESNQNEFVELATRAKQLGIAPHVLRGTCKDYDDIVKAGDDAIGVMLEKIARITAVDVEKLLERPHRAGDLVLTYGGALHNDLVPRAGRETMSFGPELDRVTGGKYVELDLIVPEYIKDTETWRALEWYPAYDRTRFGNHAVLFRLEPRSFVLIFPPSLK